MFHNTIYGPCVYHPPDLLLMGMGAPRAPSIGIECSPAIPSGCGCGWSPVVALPCGCGSGWIALHRFLNQIYYKEAKLTFKDNALKILNWRTQEQAAKTRHIDKLQRVLCEAVSKRRYTQQSLTKHGKIISSRERVRVE